jgi:hypothetical protein
LLYDDVVEPTFVVTGSITDEILAGLALAERASGCLAAVTASKALEKHLNPP